MKRPGLIRETLASKVHCYWAVYLFPSDAMTQQQRLPIVTYPATGETFWLAQQAKRTLTARGLRCFVDLLETYEERL